MGRQWRRGVALMLGIGLLGSACSSGGGDDAGQEAAEGTVGGSGFSMSITEPQHLLPPNTNDTFGLQVLTALFTGLVEYDAQSGEPRNAMAESITSADQRDWTIKLRSGWTFHSGEEVTSASFVDAWNFAAYAPNAMGNSSFFDKIEGYDALQGDPDATPPVSPTARELSGLAIVDDSTFTVRLEDPFSQFPVTLGYQGYYPLPKAAFSDLKAYEQQPVGNGPFMMDGPWRHDEAIRLKAYEDYPGPAPKADAVELRIYGDDETAVRDLEGGNLDVVRSVPVGSIAALREEMPDGLVERPSPSFNYLGFPMHDPVFAKKKELRQAFSMAINRQEIVDTILDGTSTPAGSVVAPVVPGARADACAACQFNPTRAKELLTQAGGWKGPLTLWFRAGAGNDEVMQAIANQLRTNLGISDIQFKTLELAELKSLISSRQISGPFRFNWSMDYPSAQSYVEPPFKSDSTSNRSGYDNPRVDALIAEGNRASTPESSLKAYQAAEDIILDDMPVIPLWFGDTYTAHSDRVAGAVMDPFGQLRLQDIRVVG